MYIGFGQKGEYEIITIRLQLRTFGKMTSGQKQMLLLAIYHIHLI
jgi:hypothetical protein